MRDVVLCNLVHRMNNTNSASHPLIYIALQSFGKLESLPLRTLEEAGFEVRLNRLGRRLVQEEMADLLRDAHGVIAGVEPYRADLLAQLSNLRCISRCGVGLDSVDLEAAKSHNIAVLSTPDEVVQPAAELTLSFILALARNLGLHQENFHRGIWEKQTGYLLSEWTIGLIGYGRIAQAVRRLLVPFGPRVLASDPRLPEGEMLDDTRICGLPELLEASDLVSLHAARSPKEGAILSRRELLSMKPGSRLVNIARGHLVEEEALVEALQSGHLSAAALDVFEVEPYTGPLAQMPQVLLTPHVATLSRSSRVQMELRAAQNIIHFFQLATAAFKQAAS